MGYPERKRGKKERERERERENYPVKSPNLRHCQACSQNKGLSKHQRRASQMQTNPSPAGDKQSGGRQPEPERGNHGSREASSTKLQTDSIANQEFLGFWMVDIYWEGCSQR